MEMNQFDLKSHVYHVIKLRKEHKQRPMSIFEMFGESVGAEVGKAKLYHKLDVKPHQFLDGEGPIAKRLTLVIDFEDIIFQPHKHFADVACEHLADFLGWEVNGMFEASLDEEGE